MPISITTNSDFSLSKWYLDCIDRSGNTFIGYSAILKWKKLKINYSSILLYDQSNRLQVDTTFKKLKSPVLHDNSIKWNIDRLNTQGVWQSIDSHINKTLLNSDSGTINWSCYQPKAISEVLLKDHQKLLGLGYSEKLEMTIKPWELPFKELRWGRYLSENDTIIWINWQGHQSLNLLFLNGKQVEHAIIADDLISINHGEYELSISDKIVLRKGKLISTALSKLPFIENIFPDRILHAHECKWRSKGVLNNKNNIVSDGWIIHEVVKWS